MKLMTIMGTRPEIIRLSRIIPLLDRYSSHCLVYTGQNYDRQLRDVFFEQLDIRKPDYQLHCKSATAMQQVAKILTDCEEILLKEKPDRLLILGDTNSALSAMVAKRLGIVVYHMEAGNRCFDDRVPEEVNRRIIDHSSDILLPYSESSRMNLLHEGIPANRVLVTGNPIKEVLDFYHPKIAQSVILEAMQLSPKAYFLVTLHRAENVDIPERLARFYLALEKLAAEFSLPVVCSVHPRTRTQLNQTGISKELSGNIRLIEPLGLFDFIALQKNAFCVLSDSGTVQEESCIFQVPNVTLRDVTERPETLEAGSNCICGDDFITILQSVRLATECKSDWTPPPAYLKPKVSETVARILMGHRHV